MNANGILNNAPNHYFEVCLRNLNINTFKPETTVFVLRSLDLGTIFTLKPQRLFRERHPNEAGPKAITDEDKPTPPVKEENVPTYNLNMDWKEDIPTGSAGKHDKDRIFDQLVLFSTMWLGNIGVIKSTQLRIDLAPGVKQIHRQPYREGSKA